MASTDRNLVIQSSKGWASLGIFELWEYRDLVYLLIVREIQGVYRQTALGISWLIIRPVINSFLFTVIFSGLVKVSSGDIPYPLFSLAALIPWGYFSNSVYRASRSLVDNTQVISKVFFPRIALPVAAAISGLVDMAASFLVFFVAMVLYHVPLRWEMLFVPLFVIVSVFFSLAVGLWLATLSVKYRDVSFAVTFILQALMYLSPVIYPLSLVPKSLQFIYQLNPMTGVIQGFRWALLGSEAPPGIMFIISFGIILIGLISGAFIFRRTERTIVDIL
jgi:lipopolysaccharide transport system permease protein